MATDSLEMQREAARRWVDDLAHRIRLAPGWLVVQVGWVPQNSFRVWEVQGIVEDETVNNRGRVLGLGDFHTVSGRVCDELLRRIRFEMPMSSVIALKDMTESLSHLVDFALADDEGFRPDFPSLFGEDGFYSGSPALVRFVAHIDIIRFFN